MRPSNKSRSRNKSSGGNQRRSMGNIINRVFESAGPDGKVRGTPQQIIDKYHGLARDAQVSGDRVAAESFLQHAEHYSRLLGEAQRQQQEARQSQDDAQRDNQQRRGDEGQRGEAQQRGDGQRSDDQRSEGGPGQPERREVRDTGEASGLTTIDTQEGGDDSGPVETPESRQSAPTRSGNGAHAPDGGDDGRAGQMNGNGSEPAAEQSPPKRPRTRRKAKSDTQDDATAPADSA